MTRRRLDLELVRRGLVGSRSEAQERIESGVVTVGGAPTTKPARLVAAGEASVGVLIRPTGIDEIRRTANERLLMPPKSTFFTPKLRTGLVLRPLA